MVVEIQVEVFWASKPRRLQINIDISKRLVKSQSVKFCIQLLPFCL